MNTPLLANEIVIKEGPANLSRGIEGVGGKLFLTNQRLIFEAHSVNIQAGMTLINLSDIKSSKKSWTKFLSIIPIFPNGLDVELNTGDILHFTVYGSGEWKDAVGK